MTAELLAVGMMTPVGLDAPSTAANLRAGGNRLREVPVYDRNSEPVVTARLDDAELPPLSHRVDAMGAGDPRETRLLRLAGPALREATAAFGGEAMPLFLGVPEPWPGLVDPVGPDFLERLSAQASVELDLAGSRVYRDGRAAGLRALADALALLATHRVPRVLVGGVDTYDDLPLLKALIAEGRLEASGPSDRMIPGEGAGFLVLGTATRATAAMAPALARVEAARAGLETAHFYSAEPHRGEGLGRVLAALFAGLPADSPPVRVVYASLNGEGFWAKEWGVAHLRNRARFAEALRTEHPADCFGDTGAAHGPLLVGLAALGLSSGYREEPCLIYCSSDRGALGAAVVRAIPRERR